MTDLLMDVNLQEIPDVHFDGNWAALSRVLNRNAPSSLLAQATRPVLGPGQLETHAAPSSPAETGRWAVARDELLNRPYLRFELPTEDTRVLVTRLRRSADGLRSQISLLYFQPIILCVGHGTAARSAVGTLRADWLLFPAFLFSL